MDLWFIPLGLLVIAAGTWIEVATGNRPKRWFERFLDELRDDRAEKLAAEARAEIAEAKRKEQSEDPS